MRLPRRAALRLLLGGALAAATGCPPPRRAPARPRGPVGGRVWGDDPDLGHLVRDGALRDRPPAREERAGVLVIGAGVAGLACAWRLARDGVDDVVLVDVGEDPGGNARGGRNDVSAYPWGAHYLRVPTTEHRALERFLEDVGLLRGRDARGRPDWDTRAVCPAPHERLWQAGLWTEHLFPPPLGAGRDDLDAMAAFQARVEALGARRGADGRRAFALPVDASSRDPDLLALDGLSMAAWLEREGLAGSAALRWWVDYACRDDYGCSLEDTSAWAALHYFAARSSDDPTRDVTLTWPEGNARLVTLLRAAAPRARFEGRAPCVRLEPGAAPGEPSAAHVYHAATGEVVRWVAREVVWAAPRFVLGRVLDAPPPGLEAFTYAPWLVANVTLARAPAGVGAPLAWDNVFYGKPSLGYVVANRAAPPDAPSVVTWYRPFAELSPAEARARLLALDHAAIVDLALEELLEVHPSLAEQVLAVDAWRWGHAMIRPVPGFVWGPARAAALEPIGALLQACSDLSGIPVFEEAFYRGVLAGEEVLRRAGRPFDTLL
ncbi:MAG: FAD-dependent oxidoreductase [Planctomycetes bacterium]|nr:FAD-dependent oxidoreductase [Planctomycetota bacterium]